MVLDNAVRREPNHGAATPSDVVSVSSEDEFNNELRDGSLPLRNSSTFDKHKYLSR